MKKIILYLVMAVMVLGCFGCGSKTENDNYSGTWVRETWTNEKTGAVIDITLYLYEDNTYKEEVNNSVEGYKEYQGAWEVSNNEIILTPSKLNAGEDANFGEDGRLKEGITNLTNTLKIVDNTTLSSGATTYNKQH